MQRCSHVMVRFSKKQEFLEFSFYKTISFVMIIQSQVYEYTFILVCDVSNSNSFLNDCDCSIMEAIIHSSYNTKQCIMCRKGESLPATKEKAASVATEAQPLMLSV